MPKQTLKWMIRLLFIPLALTAYHENTEITEGIRAITTINVSEQAAVKATKFSGLAPAVDSSNLSF
jgi:hypothetical protein